MENKTFSWADLAELPWSQWANFLAGTPNNNADREILQYGEAPLKIFGFFDSRASRLEADKSQTWLSTLSEFLRNRKISHLFICRPLDNTVFFSLLNFLQAVPLQTELLITNMGFVDFTPKKQAIILDLLLQKEQCLPQYECQQIGFETIQLLDGSAQEVYSLVLDSCAQAIAERLAAHARKTMLLLTHEFPENCEFPRKRPLSFFRQLKKTNLFLQHLSELQQSVTCCTLPQAEDYREISYDGVHYVAAMHEKIAKSLWQEILTHELCEK